jgi:hypothetical protein
MIPISVWYLPPTKSGEVGQATDRHGTLPANEGQTSVCDHVVVDRVVQMYNN